MITWEHVRFLALLIPTWVVLGAIGVSVAVPAKGRAGPVEAAVQAGVAPCKDSVAVAMQPPRGGLVGTADPSR